MHSDYQKQIFQEATFTFLDLIFDILTLGQPNNEVERRAEKEEEVADENRPLEL